MSFAAALFLAAATTPAPPPEPVRGVELATAQVRATILQPAIVRQGKGPETVRDAPAPQVTRRGGTVLVEFQ